MLVFNRIELVADLEQLAAASGQWHSAECGLFKNDIVPSSLTQFINLEVADFDGYDPITVSWAPAFLNALGQPELFGDQPAIFACDGDTTPNTIYGWYLRSGVGDLNLIAAERFANPIGIVAVGQQIVFVPIIRPLNAGGGAALIS